MEKKRLIKKFKDKLKPLQKKEIINVFFLISYIVTIFFLIYFIMQTALQTQFPVGIAISNSMEPYIKKGDLIFIRGIDPAEIKSGTVSDKTGDIIAFDARGLWYDAPDTPIVHRVVKKWQTISGWYFLTKGDASPTIDGAAIPENRIYGILWGKIQFIGWLIIALTNPIILISVIAVILLVPLMLRRKKKEILENYKS